MGYRFSLESANTVEDIGFPVHQHLSAGLKLLLFEPVAGVKPVFQASRGCFTIRCVHEIIECFLQGIGLHEPVREAEHDVHSGAILVG